MNFVSGAMDSAKDAADSAKNAAAAAVPDMPSISIPGGCTKQDITDAKKELTDIQGDLDPKLKMSPPTVNIKIPRLEALPGEAPALGGAVPNTPLDSDGSVKTAEVTPLVQPDIPEIPAVPTGQALMDNALPYVSAAIGVAIGTAGAIASKGNPSSIQLMGTALATTVVTTLGSAKSWDGKAMQVQKAAMAVVGSAKKKIATVLDQVDDILCKPISVIEKQIDSIGKEDPLKKVMAAAKAFEKTTGKDVPDPQDFKKPIDGIPQKLEEKVGEVKKMINDKIDDYVPDVLEKPSSFRMVAVVLPMFLLLILNTGAAFATMPTPAAPAPEGGHSARRLFLDARSVMFDEEAHVYTVVQQDTLAKEKAQRRLPAKDERKGANGRDHPTAASPKEEEEGKGEKAEKGEKADEEKDERADDPEARKGAPTHSPATTTHQPATTTSAAKEGGDASHEKKGEKGDDDMMAKVLPLIQPQLTQAFLTILAAILGMVATAKPFLLKQLNGAIGMLEGKVNKRIQEEMKEMMDNIFGDTFTQLQAKSDEFFPKMIDLLETLEKVPGIA